jgi:hypothetical protein
LCKACSVLPLDVPIEPGALWLLRGLVAQLAAHFRLLGRAEMAWGLRTGRVIAFIFLTHQGLTQIRTALDVSLFNL